MSTLRTLDYGHLATGTASQRKRFIQELVAGLGEAGFVKLVNHGFDDQKLSDVFNWVSLASGLLTWKHPMSLPVLSAQSKTFFGQPLEAKNSISSPAGLRPRRGYTGVSVETSSNADPDVSKRGLLRDAKEHFDQGSENDREYANQWLTMQGLTGFRPFMVAFYKQCEVVNLTLIQAVEAGFGLEAGCLVARCIPNNTDLRITHYPALPVEAVRTGGMTRIAPHTDFGVITLLFQDSTGGLEIEDRTRTGVYHPLPPTNTREMIVNVGDTLQRWTNGRLFSGRHRVTVPESLGDDAEELPERYSVAYLGKAQRHASVGPVASFVSVDNPAKYNDLNAQEYLNMRAQLVSSVGN